MKKTLFTCPECKHTHQVSFWRLSWTPKLFDIWWWVKCPACKKLNWIKKNREEI